MSYFCINQIKHLKNNYSDSYLYDYENLDLLNTKQSFFQDGKSFDSFIKSKYLYFKNSSFYKNISKDEDTPEKIIKVIHNKLKSEELKNILEAYKNIKNTNLQEYILFSKNTLYMLCAPRLNIDEESIFNNIFHKDLSNIFKFYTSMRKKMKGIEDEEKALLIVQYRISALFFNMISKSYTFAILQHKESDFHKNAMTFIPYEEKIEEEKKSYKNRFHFINEPKFTKQILEKVKEIELISKAVEDILDEIIKNQDNLKYKDSVDKYLKSLRTFSSTIAFLRIIDFTLMDSKSFKDFSQFTNDVLSLTIFTSNFLKNSKGILNTSTLAILVKELQKDRKMLFTNLSITNRFNIIFIIVNAVIDSKKLYENDDYDALAANLAMTILTIITFFIPSIIAIRILFLQLVFGLVFDLVKDSDLVAFLKKTIFAISLEPSKEFKPHYLEVAFKNQKELNISFSNPNELISFFGENYSSYKSNFEVALKNELQFLHTTLIELKFEIDKKVTEEEIYIKGVKKKLLMMSNLIIPSYIFDNDFSIIIKDKTFRNNNKTFIEENNGKILFDLRNKDIKNDLKDEKIDLIIKASSMELKYKVIYKHYLTTDPKYNCDLKVSLEQIYFNMDDLQTKEIK
ncbi:hypothetical protein AAX29_02028 [Aliarcobacter thereius]|uniref:Uncharacterized protein n=1 Tax=Aliarcobacter thereius TaxID=544718 RepID=A0A1C0B344_9BACT|nr:hypothetical protein [Aliarcobacter thereius]OCL96696.1 hypothetical protein AAX29_02028 [Aliarcobacter thereius]